MNALQGDSSSGVGSARPRLPGSGEVSPMQKLRREAAAQRQADSPASRGEHSHPWQFSTILEKRIYGLADSLIGVGERTDEVVLYRNEAAARGSWQLTGVGLAKGI